MPEQRTLPERLVELALFVPVGIAASVVEELPSLAEKGREKLSGQLELARLIGKMAVGQAQRRLGKEPPRPSAPPESPVGEPPVSGSPAAGAAASPRPRPTPPAKGPVQTAAKAASPVAKRAAGAGAAPTVADLPIPGYDTLAASQVVQRLGSLRPEELDAVRRYEVATRGRRTILHRIAQLSTPDSRASA